MISRLASRLLLATAVVTVAPIATSAYAQSAITPGMQIVDPAGSPVGTVVAVKGADVTIKTDQHEVLYPASSFTPNEGKLLFAMTRAQVNAAAAQALAAARASLVPGVAVHGKGGALAGHIEAIDDTLVTLKLVSGELLRMPRSGVAPAEHGAVLGVSVEELKAMAAPVEAPAAEAADAQAGQAAEPEGQDAADAPGGQQ